MLQDLMEGRFYYNDKDYGLERTTNSAIIFKIVIPSASSVQLSPNSMKDIVEATRKAMIAEIVEFY